MYITIGAIVFCLFCIILIILKWEGTISLLPLSLCIAGIIVIIAVSDDVISTKPKTENINDSNLIEYVEYISQRKLSYEFEDIYTTATVNMRAEPGLNGEVITRIPVNSFIDIQTAEPVEGWFEVKHNEQVGWVYGKYIKRQSVNITYQSKFGTGLNSSFPEKSWYGKLFSFLVGALLSFVLAVLGFMEDILLIFRIAVTWAYFFIKNLYITHEINMVFFTYTNLFLMIIIAAIISVTLNILVNLILNIIKDQRAMISQNHFLNNPSG